MVIYIDGLAPTNAHDDDAAFDIRAESSAILSPGSCRLVPSGFAIAIPEGHVGLICSRSGLAINNGVFVLNAPGVIDPGYRGDVGVILMNLSPWEFQIETGDRIAQLLIVPTTDAQLVQNKNAIQAPTTRGSRETSRRTITEPFAPGNSCDPRVTGV